eukprot:UN11936
MNFHPKRERCYFTSFLKDKYLTFLTLEMFKKQKESHYNGCCYKAVDRIQNLNFHVKVPSPSGKVNVISITVDVEFNFGSPISVPVFHIFLLLSPLRFAKVLYHHDGITLQ